jgi:hypothetical protein
MGRGLWIINGCPAARGRCSGRDRPSGLRRGVSHVITQEGSQMVRFFLLDYPQVFLETERLQMEPVLVAAITAAILLLTPNFSIALCTWK